MKDAAKGLVLAGMLAWMVPVMAEVKVGDIPSVQPAKEIPPIVFLKNEAVIASSFSSNPEAVLGALVNTETGEVLILDRYAKASAKPKMAAKGEVIFRNLVERDLGATADYLGIVSAGVDDKKKTELILTRSGFTSVPLADLELDQLKAKVTKLGGQIKNYGLIIGYTEYLWTATSFVEATKKSEAKGFGANVGGKWYNRSENSSVIRTVVAQYAPLTLVTGLAIPKVDKGMSPSDSSDHLISDLLKAEIQMSDLKAPEVLEVKYEKAPEPLQ